MKTIQLKTAIKKCEKLKILLRQTLPQYNWTVYVTGMEMIIADLDSNDFKYTKAKGWGKSQRQVTKLTRAVFKNNDIELAYKPNGDIWAKQKAYIKGIEIIPNKKEKSK